ncbi:MAG: hypothetical protein Kow00106_09310 [Anaerolineae bacterium]
MPATLLNQALPALFAGLAEMPALHDPEVLWPLLERLLVAHAPSTGAALPGGIGDDIAALAGDLGLGNRWLGGLGATGNCALYLGAQKSGADLMVVAHMDRPSFRVRSLADGELFPICANRFPPGEYRAPAKAVRFAEGRLVVGAAGVLISRKGAEGETLHFEAKRGQLGWGDTVLLDVHPLWDGAQVLGTGLDNSLGVLTALLTAAALRRVEDALLARHRRCLFVFSDQEEGPPESFFGHGAARLTYALPAPSCGVVVVDAHTAGPSSGLLLGGGVSVSAASGWGRGSLVPPNYHALALALTESLNAQRPGTAQLNTGYLSRSDDMVLGRWARVLALVGPPMIDPHTGYERAVLSDVQGGVWWLSAFLVAALGLSAELSARYGLNC